MERMRGMAIGLAVKKQAKGIASRTSQFRAHLAAHHPLRTRSARRAVSM